MWDDPEAMKGYYIFNHETPKKVLIHIDSRTVVMEAEIRLGVCNNSSAKWNSPENE